MAKSAGDCALLLKPWPVSTSVIRLVQHPNEDYGRDLDKRTAG